MNVDLGSYQAILFDVDGTLAETEGLGHLPAFNSALEQVGVPWRWDAQIYKKLLRITGGFERLKAYREMLREHDASEASQLPSDSLLKEVHLIKNQIYTQLVERGVVQSRPGLFGFINQIAAQQKIWGIVTTTSRSNWDGLWQWVLKEGMQTEPAVVICGEDVMCKKPNPEAYVLAAQKLNLDPGTCLAVEDSENGVIAAKEAGMEVLVVRSQFFADGDFSDASYVVNHFTEIQPNY